MYLKPRPKNRSQPWIYGKVVEKPTPRFCAVKTGMGPVRYNHCQIRRAKAEQANGYSTVKDQLEIASTHSEQDQERQPPNVDSTGETMPSIPRIESEDTLPATKNVDHANHNVSADCSYRTCFRDYVKSRLFNRTSSFVFLLLVFGLRVFFKRGRVLHKMYHTLRRCTTMYHTLRCTMLLAYYCTHLTLHLCTPCTHLVIATY